MLTLWFVWRDNLVCDWTNNGSAKSTMVEPHPLDEKYASLSCAIKPVERDEVVWSLIAKMLENTGVPLSSKRFLCGFKGQKQGKNAKPPQLLEVYDLARCAQL